MSFRLNLPDKLRGKGEISTSDLSYLPQTNKTKVAEKHPQVPPHRSGGPCGSAGPSALKWSCQRLWLQLAHRVSTLKWHRLKAKSRLPCSKILGLVCKRAATCYASYTLQGKYSWVSGMQQKSKSLHQRPFRPPCPQIHTFWGGLQVKLGNHTQKHSPE